MKIFVVASSPSKKQEFLSKNALTCPKSIDKRMLVWYNKVLQYYNMVKIWTSWALWKCRSLNL
jgi:hypothetical protein